MPGSEPEAQALVTADVLAERLALPVRASRAARPRVDDLALGEPLITTTTTAAPPPTTAAPAPTTTTTTAVKPKPATTTTTTTAPRPTTTTTAQPANTATGDASWYDTDAGTCAHRSLPFGTIVTVTNLENGKQVRCRVADRGPYGDGRVIDLARDVFAAIAPLSQGVVPVRIQW